MLRVLFVPLDDGVLTRAAWDWLERQADMAVVRAPADEVPRLLRLVRPDVLWIDAATPPDASPGAWAESSGNGSATAAPGLLLTRGAAALPAQLGLEPELQTDFVDRPWRDTEDELFFFDDFSESPRLRGHAAFRRHRLFSGLGSGAYTWRPTDGERDCRTTPVQPAWPARGRVIAVERAFIHINPARATIWEYDAPRRALCIGAYLPYESSDTMLRAVLDRLTRNALLRAAGRLPAHPNGPDLCWPAPDGRLLHDPSLDAAPAPVQSDTGDARLPLDITPLRYPVERTADSPFTLAGRRAFVAGYEHTGPVELWVHPLRALRIEQGVGPTAGPVEISPLGLTRHAYTDADAASLGRASVVERTTVLHELPAAVLEWECAASPHPPAHIRLTFVVDLRLMWPYPAGVLGPLRWNSSATALRVRSAVSEEEVLLVTSTPVSWMIEDASEGTVPRLRCSLDATVQPGTALRLTALARVDCDGPTDTRIESAMAAAGRVRTAAAALARRTAHELRVDAPDTDVRTAIACALARLDACRVETPGVGRSLIAGYWMSQPGWNEGRPGYAWYFGRDAVWSALAFLGAADPAPVREVIAFLAAHQDVSGKILHECTTSGSVHYDAADATPLWLLLVARHHAWTGDAAFVRAHWSHVLRAIRFCLSTDTDADGLIENTGVGHGWIEFGRLGGGTVTYYNAGIWTAALRELAVVARDIGETATAAELDERARTARVQLERLFWDADARGYALKADARDGEWVRDTTRTATHAVPLLLGVADPARAGRWLEAVRTPDFTAEWGVRMISRTEPGFDPGSYHGGAVWPLYTGWVAWAEYAAGRSEAAFRHWRMNVALAFEGAKGAWHEVLHGTERRGIGVCPDQAWSTAMVLAPFVHGLLGAEADATRGRLQLRPQIPLAWDRLDVNGLRIGDAIVSLRYRRGGRIHAFTIEQVEGAVPLRLVFEPAIPAVEIGAVRIDGITATLHPRPHGERMLVPVQLALDHARTVEIEVP